MCFQSLIKSLKVEEGERRTAEFCFEDLVPPKGTMLKQLLQINRKSIT